MKSKQVICRLIVIFFLKVSCLQFILTSELLAQNLIINGSFESYNKKPLSAQYFLINSQLSYCNGWDACCNPIKDSCGSTNYFVYPSGFEGKSSAQPRRPFNGNAFISIFAYDPPPAVYSEGPLYREYASGRLVSPLEVGKKYKLSLAHTNGQFSSRSLKPFAHNGFGVLLSTNHPIQKSDFSRLIEKPQFRTPYLISDSIWRVMEFEFIADSAYTHITIGNFFEGWEIEVQNYSNGNPSYIFLDDIKIELIADTPKLPKPLTICKPDTVYLKNSENKPVEWWINGEYWGWAVGLKHYYSHPINTVVVKYYNDYDTTFVYIKSKPNIAFTQEGYLCPWLGIPGLVSFISLDSLSSFYWLLPNKKVYESKLQVFKGDTITFIYTSPKQCEWIQKFEAKDTCPKLNTCYFPNSFSPNNDGLNETYKIECDNKIEFEIRIFNRWGELIFYSSNPMQEWDGTFKGEDCPIGIYMVVINTINPSEEGYFKSKTERVSLNLIR
jgi:gliding motility-associated-like protein